ncbi:alpha/beta fold family hydrolase [Nitzschia inconspicua]|uniref:Alpha/beta fold family hydrolase n=1 Tax=Nitzschia inconspicua TaxID=303405 RepID=A0A9K3KII0_9STRA|nr:alpha/beta fold family hydrolase [Nitzschia inconspicua]
MNFHFLILLAIACPMKALTNLQLFPRDRMRTRQLSLKEPIVDDLGKAKDPGASDDIICTSNTVNDIHSKSRVTGWRKMWHNWLRDSGGLRIMMNSATRMIAAPKFYQDYPECFPDFLRISGSEYSWLVRILRFLQIISDDQLEVTFTKESYGPHPMQVAEVLVNTPTKDAYNNSTSQRIFFFFHGGAWGSGFPTMYRLISVPFLQRGYRVVILGYRTYPDGKVDDQVDDLARAVNYFVQKYGGIGGINPPVVLMGHSSGAHISLLAALKGRIPAVQAIIALSGVYDCAAQVDHEQTLEVDQLSPLSPVTGMTRNNMNKYSPAYIISQEDSAIPPILLLHGQEDTVVLPSSSSSFYQKLQHKSASPRKDDLMLLSGSDHKDPVVHTLVGGPAQSIIFEWLDKIWY